MVAQIGWWLKAMEVRGHFDRRAAVIAAGLDEGERERKVKHDSEASGLSN